ncbi:hypothetical protein DERP_003767 [Dermatophagoides pteronyssinus]|uniref:Glycosyltransferase family 92 protein n=1 Tax=Dermatophagoides pteronyssinus TaxID=6956 RepID=A0ABQ8JLJ3_DERPT|nr:hypothetical protein DERP_003767 [Dermatophagoides pteronyssinus]
MFQIKLPVRAYKKLIYLASVSSFLCFLALHLTISYQRDHIEPTNYDIMLNNNNNIDTTNGNQYGSIITTPTGGGGGSVNQIVRNLLHEKSDTTLIITDNNSSSSSSGNKSKTFAIEKSSSNAQQSSLSSTLSSSSSMTFNPHSKSSLSSANQQTDNQDNDDENIDAYLDLEPHIDQMPILNENQQLIDLENQNHGSNNLALSYWLKARKYPKPKSSTNTSNSNSKSCRVEFPNLYELEYNNIYWQKFTNFNGNGNGSSFYLYGAYYDNRWRGGPLPMIRILAMIDRIAPPPTFCQIWFDRISVPIISQASYIYGWYNKWGNYKDGYLQPYIITCKIPRIKGLPKDFYPTSVSLDWIFLHEDLSVRLVEWIELLRLLGANKIFLYELEIHPNISKVLDYYQRDGHQPNLPGFRHLYLKNKLTHKRQNELIPYNDCLYRNLYSYDYVALLDIDEIIMPIKHSNWSDLMAEIQRLSLMEKNYTRASYNVRNVYFLDDLNHNEEQMQHEAHEAGIPRYLHMLQHVYRSQNYTKPGQYVKCFHNTERAVSLHNHFPLNCFGTCTTYSIPIELAQLQHYRKDCVGPLKKSCKEFRQYTTRDTTIFRYKHDLVQRTTHVLKTLGFFDQNSIQEQQHSNA